MLELGGIDILDLLLLVERLDLCVLSPLSADCSVEPTLKPLLFRDKTLMIMADGFPTVHSAHLITCFSCLMLDEVTLKYSFTRRLMRVIWRRFDSKTEEQVSGL